MANKFLIVIAVFLLLSDADAADQALQRNPFNRPALLQGVARNSADDANDGEMILRATLVAGENSTANINGKFIRIGETINGYKLVFVAEGKAVFQKDGSPVTLAVFDAILDGQNGEY